MRRFVLAILMIVFVAAAGAKAEGEAGHRAEVYGPALAVVRQLGIGPTMAASVVGDRLYAIGQGQLHVFDVARPAEPRLLGRLGGLGNTRQIAVGGSTAYVTSREHGVFLVDVSEPSEPKLLSHYDSIEVATGVDVAGEVLLVACRHHGVELVDVSDPRKPRHLAVARTGEAQSVAVRGSYAYVGVWGSSELVVVDVRNPSRPKITARCGLDGYGDGVAVHGRYVLVATGHHSRARTRSYPGPGDAGYGRGHGLEVFEIGDPARPRFVSRIKMPPFYHIGMDMWSVQATGRYAFVADTHNGLFVIDIQNPRSPAFVAHRQLPLVARYGLPGVVGGLALAEDYLYVAGAWTDLEVVEARGLARPVETPRDKPPPIPAAEPETPTRFRVYRPDGQVRSVGFLGDLAVVAAGSGGIRLVQLWPEIVELGHQPTEGFAMKLRVLGDRVYAAESEGGLSIWKCAGSRAPQEGCRLELEGRYRPHEGYVRDVVVHQGGRYAMLGVDLSTLQIVDVAKPTQPRLVFRDTGHGFLYHLGEDQGEDGSLCVLWQLGGLRWYEPAAAGGPRFAGREYPFRLGNTGSVPWGDDRLVVYRGGLLPVNDQESRPPDELTTVRVAGASLRGIPRRQGDLLFVAERSRGDVSVVELSETAAPKLLDQFNVPGNPAEVVQHQGTMVIANGYEGLWVERRE